MEKSLGRKIDWKKEHVIQIGRGFKLVEKDSGYESAYPNAKIVKKGE